MLYATHYERCLVLVNAWDYDADRHRLAMPDCGIHAHEHLAALQPELVANPMPLLLKHILHHQDNALMHHGCGVHLSLTAVAARLPRGCYSCSRFEGIVLCSNVGCRPGRSRRARALVHFKTICSTCQYHCGHSQSLLKTSLTQLTIHSTTRETDTLQRGCVRVLADYIYIDATWSFRRVPRPLEAGIVPLLSQAVLSF
jgi:hypothetical protein